MNRHLEITALSKTFATPRGPLTVVRDFDLHLARGEFVCLIGHSGCGKSTVLSMVAGLSEPDADRGGIVLAGKELRGPGPDRGMVFQSPSLLPWLTALENVLLGIDQVFYTASSAERRQIAEYYLTVVGLGDALHKLPSELSQGMRQRVGIARAFALSPKMLLLDEPFGMLDALTRVELQEVLLQLWTRNNLTALMVTHDVEEALLLSDRVVMMTNGPAARVGDVLEVPFPRPRDRKTLVGTPEFAHARARLIRFLEHDAYVLAGQNPARSSPSDPVPPGQDSPHHPSQAPAAPENRCIPKPAEVELPALRRVSARDAGQRPRAPVSPAPRAERSTHDNARREQREARPGVSTPPSPLVPISVP